MSLMALVAVHLSTARLRVPRPVRKEAATDYQAGSLRAFRAAAIGLAILAGAGRSQAQCTYSVTFVEGFDCGPGQGNATLMPEAINDLGHATGHYTCGPGLPRGFIYTPEEGVVPMGVIPDTFQLRPQAISNNDVIVGHIDLAGAPTQAFIWEKGQYTLLPPPKGAIWSYAYGVNDAGIVCGSAGNPGDLEACIWIDGELQFLQSLPAKGSVAYDVNNNKAVVGQMGQVSLNLDLFDALGFFWLDQGTISLGAPEGWLGSAARTVSLLDHVAGDGWIKSSKSPAGFFAQALAWSDHEVTALGVIPGYVRSFATELNVPQEIVGHCTNSAGHNSAFIWRECMMHSLNDLVESGFDGEVWQGHSINESGVILASGLDSGNGGYGMLILTPQTQSPADLNHDCQTDATDLEILFAQWGVTNAASADFDDDGLVGPADLAALLADWME